MRCVQRCGRKRTCASFLRSGPDRGVGSNNYNNCFDAVATFCQGWTHKVDALILWAQEGSSRQLTYVPQISHLPPNSGLHVSPRRHPQPRSQTAFGHPKVGIFARPLTPTAQSCPYPATYPFLSPFVAFRERHAATLTPPPGP